MAVEALARFVAVVHAPEAAVELDAACLLVARQAYRGLDVDEELGRLDELAAGCREPTLDGLRRHLFRDLGFAGNTDHYYDPRNSYLNEVVDRRTGIPITLSVLTMEVGRRIGVPLSGVGMPGHFLLRDKVDPTVFVDPFDRGATLDAAACERRFRVVHGPGVPFDPAFLEPVGRVAIVARVLANLESIHTATGDAAGLASVLRLRVLLPGAERSQVGKLARILASGGDYRAAAADLERLAGVVPPGGGDPVRDALRAAAGRLRAKLN